MPTIRIKNVGPVKDTGPLVLSRYNVFIGPQNSGKSTIMKIICFCSWVEKQITAGKADMDYYRECNRFIDRLKSFYRFDDTFFAPESEIRFTGDYVSIDYYAENGDSNPVIRWNDHIGVIDTRLCFIPSVRNFVFAFDHFSDTLNKSIFYESDYILNFLNEWNEYRSAYPEYKPLTFPFLDGMAYCYDKSNNREYIRMRESGKVMLPYHASGGVRFLLPVMVAVDYLTKCLFDSEAPRQNSSSYGYSQIFIEEPEQNLFPATQYELIQAVAERINRRSSEAEKDCTLHITTHSPYILSAINTLILAHKALGVDKQKTTAIIPEHAAIPFDKVSAYFVRGDGTAVSVMDEELSMIVGNDLDCASDMVEDSQARLNDIIFRN